MKYAIPCAIALSSACPAALVLTLPGNSESEGWDGLTSANYGTAQGFPTYGTAGNPWPSAIAANLAGSAQSAVFEKVSGAGYFASSSLYDTGAAGVFRLSDSSPIANLATVVFQADVGTSIGVLPVLNYNGGSQGLIADFSALVDGDHLTFDFSTGDSFPTLNHAWQWDLSGIVDPITSYEIVWGSIADNHLTQYELNLTSGDSFVQVIPEPSTWLLIGLGPLSILRRRRAH